MGPIGIPEMLFILAIALLIFGPRRLPEFGRTIGKALGEFRRATTDLKRSLDVEMMTAEPTRPEPSTRASSAAAAAATAPGESSGGAGDDPEPSTAAAETEPDAASPKPASAPRRGSADDGAED